ncbi:MAG: arginine--tRNA ligase [Chloroflexota bacterium]|nr:arginine--tRNA ligase [Chloroflexota bacterium]
MKHRIAQLVADAVEEAQRQGSLPSGPIPDIEVEHPQNPEHGDFAVSLPLKLARAARMAPLAIADRLVSLLPPEEAVEQVRIAPPGFINFEMKQDWLHAQLTKIIEDGEGYGGLQSQNPLRVQIEFVSVNPTGPLHVGHARGAVLGSGLARILEAAGHQVSREYYINDAGTQIEVFNRSLYARYAQALGREVAMPSDGYLGDYMNQLAKEVIAEDGQRFLEMPEADATKAVGEIGLNKMLTAIGEDLETIDVSFDVWFSERSLYQDQFYDHTIEQLRDSGYLTEREGALWFVSTLLGEEKDNVIVRGTGEPTYFATDIAYHRNKFVERQFDKVINVWGADHQGHVSRLKAAMEALAVDPSRLTVIISQLVTLKRGDEAVRVSKRKGDIVTLRELVDEVGPDACRFFFLSRSPESQMEFDLDLAVQDSSDNPVFYVQYAHARTAGILRLAKERGLAVRDGNISLLNHEAEKALIKKMLQLPELIEIMAQRLEPHHLPRYSVDLATAFHWFYQECRVVSTEPGEEAITLARLKLVEACRIVLARCLSLMGMNAPDTM